MGYATSHRWSRMLRHLSNTLTEANVDQPTVRAHSRNPKRPPERLMTMATTARIFTGTREYPRMEKTRHVSTPEGCIRFTTALRARLNE